MSPNQIPKKSLKESLNRKQSGVVKTSEIGPGRRPAIAYANRLSAFQQQAVGICWWEQQPDGRRVGLNPLCVQPISPLLTLFCIFSQNLLDFTYYLQK